MHSVEPQFWMSADAIPLAMVLGTVLGKVPGWVGGLLNSNSAAAEVSPKQDPATVMESADAQPEGPTDEPTAELAEAEAAELAESSGNAMSLVDEMLSRGRYALLLRPQLITNLSPDQLARARSSLSEGMCLVPAGEVALRRVATFTDEVEEPGLSDEAPMWVDGYYLDRFQVTNAQYSQFVRHGGYEQMAIWDPEVLPAVLDFVDQTGHPGPRFWRDGRFPRGADHHPVVGVCWYEAAAYARWVGKRLPTDAEWVKAASWPVAIVGHPLMQRRYPWGEAVDRTRANLWGSGPETTAPVDSFPGGVSVGGVQQMIGNVWEWTVDPLAIDDDEDNEYEQPPCQELKSLRGGAYDTYLDCQATNHFQSGDNALARKHNVGFRCAISLCDFEMFEGCGEAAATDSDQEANEEAES